MGPSPLPRATLGTAMRPACPNALQQGCITWARHRCQKPGARERACAQGGRIPSRLGYGRQRRLRPFVGTFLKHLQGRDARSCGTGGRSRFRTCTRNGIGRRRYDCCPRSWRAHFGEHCRSRSTGVLARRFGPRFSLGRAASRLRRRPPVWCTFFGGTLTLKRPLATLLCDGPDSSFTGLLCRASR